MNTLKFVLASALTALLALPASADGVMVFGASGQLGAPHVRMLVERGETVTAFVRETSDRKRLNGLNIQYAVGDLMDADSILTAMTEFKPRVVIDTSARRGGMMTREQPFYAEAMRNIVDAAKANGVKQIIIHSSVGVRGSAKKYLEEELGYNTESQNIRDKGEAEIYLEESGVGYTIIRNGLLEFEPAEATGNGYLIDDMNAFGRITRTDLAAVSLECMDNADCLSKIYHAQDDSLVGPRPEREGGD
ncbi:MAG: NAD(P)H-binding protein [Alphaproteobacteria bacterium]|nr:NAD(P)H-binding protein [Alphaproteobacteria bacterium]